MPVTLAQLATNSATVTLSVGEDTVTIEYYPGRVTEKTLAAMNAFAAMDGTGIDAGFSRFNEELAKLLKSWDVLEEDGSMFPIDAHRLADLPISFRLEVLAAIMGDLRPEAMAPHLNGHG